MSAGRPVKISILADSREAVQGFNKAGDSARDAGKKFEGLGESSDHLASTSSQVAGGLGDLGGALSSLPGPLGALGSGMEAAAPAIMGVTGAADLLNVVTERFPVLAKAQMIATKGVALAQRALNAVMRANPIGLLITAILALLVVVPLIVKHWDTIKRVTAQVWGVIKRVVSTAVNAVKNVITRIFNAIKTYFTTVFNIYKRVFTVAFNVIKGVVTRIFSGIRNAITHPLQGVVDFISGVPGKIRALGGKFASAGSHIMGKLVDGIRNAAGFIGHIATGIWNAVKRLLNSGIDKINNALEFTIGLPLGGSIKINPPDIPHLARGGITTGPTLALIGDNPGGREAVIPLDKFDLGGGSRTYNITINAPVGSSSADIGGVLVKHIDAYERAGGRRRAS